MPVMGGKFIWLESLMRKFVGTVQRLMKSFSISVAFGIGVFAYPIDTKPIGKTEETMQNRYAETNVRL
jgi:hypothetical protein